MFSYKNPAMTAGLTGVKFDLSNFKIIKYRKYAVL